MTSSDGLEWLRRAVEKDYEVERELGAPGDDIARVLARDLSLDRSVELLALRPEAGTAERSRKFLEWAQRLARINHPNVAAVHRATVLLDVPCLVMEHVDGETLATRLQRAPLRPTEVVRLGRDLLAGLEASHAAGVAHPGLGPEAIAWTPRRAVLVGLGGALGEGASVVADLYAAAVVLYEAVAARPWNPGAYADPAAWRLVPRRLRPVLRRALAPHPVERWPDARAFRQEFERLDQSLRRWPSPEATLRVAILMAAGAGAWALFQALRPPPPPPAPKELAVLPLEAAGDPGGDTLGLAMANMISYTIDNLPGLEPTPWRDVIRYWERKGHSVEGADAARDLKAHWVAHGLLTQRGESLRVLITVFDARGARRSLPELQGTVQTFAALSDTVGVHLIRTVAPDLEALYAPLPDLSGVPLGALKAFFQGEAAFARDAWDLGTQYYETAIGEDSTFALARWRLANIQRWRRQPYTFDLRAFYERDGSKLRPLDRALVEAMLEPDVARRLARLDSIVPEARGDAYTRFVYAEELFHRGPLVGRDIQLAARVFGEVLAIDSSFAEAYNHLFIVHLRAGRRAETRQMLSLRRRVALNPKPGDPDVSGLLQLAYDERFVPWRGAIKRWYLDKWGDSAKLADVARVSRTGVPWFDLPWTQVALERVLLRRAAPTDSARASAQTGIALALMELGRPSEALAELDSAVALDPSAEARLQQAEWRAIPHAVGLPETSGAAEPAWDARLEGFAGDPVTAVRALWALALRRLAAGDTAGFERTRVRLDSAAPASPLAVLLRAIGEGARGRPTVAMAISDSIRPVLAVNHPPDPFAGAVFHLERGDWLAAEGDVRGAQREWAWYDGSDFEGWPAGVPQAGEIDGTFGVYAGWKRGAARLASAASAADTLAACVLLRRSARLWQDAEPAMGELRSRLDQSSKGCPR